MKITPIIMWTILVASAAFLASGCSDGHEGYTFRSLYDSGTKTVFVNMFTRGREVYRRENELRLSEAVAKRLELDTPYKIAEKGIADAELSGQLDLIDQQVLFSNPETGLPREIQITFKVTMTFKDLRTGEEKVKKQFEISSTYIPHVPFDEDFFEGSEDVINKLAKRIVEQLETDW